MPGMGIAFWKSLCLGKRLLLHSSPVNLSVQELVLEREALGRYGQQN